MRNSTERGSEGLQKAPCIGPEHQSVSSSSRRKQTKQAFTVSTVYCLYCLVFILYIVCSITTQHYSIGLCVCVENESYEQSLKHLVRTDEVDELLDKQEEKMSQKQTNTEVQTRRVCHFEVTEGKGQQSQGQGAQPNRYANPIQQFHHRICL